MDKTVRKILKAALRKYNLIGLLLSFSILNVWEYESKGYFLLESQKFSGEHARTFAWLALSLSLGAFVYYTLLLVMRVTSKEERERYAKDLSEEPRRLICLRCDEPFLTAPGETVPLCPKCGSSEFEKLSGFFERHPDRKMESPPMSTQGNASNLKKFFLEGL